MTNNEFVAELLKVEALPTLYVHGTWGWPMNQKNKQRACAKDSYNVANKTTIMNADSSKFGFDCCGLIKGIRWGFEADYSKSYGGAGYVANEDKSADGLIRICKNVTTDFSGIIPGAYVYMTGHCGLYIGGGYVIECTPKWQNGVQRTVCINHPEDATGNGRKWTSWGKLPWITYEEKKGEQTKPLTIIIDDGKTALFKTIEHSFNKESVNYVKLREIADLCGYKASYDKEHKCPRLTKK